MVQKISARGFVANCWHQHRLWNLFISFENMNEDPSHEFAELFSIDTGSDATAALIAFIEQIGKKPSDLTSFCGDGDGTNTGHINGLKGQVCTCSL